MSTQKKVVRPSRQTFDRLRRRLGHWRPVLAALLVVAAAIGAGALWVSLTRTRPSYDAFGWMVWGQQLLHGHLNTDGAPSWKPLTFLFTLPYALFGRTQMSLWTLTASAAALASTVFSARIAYRLTRSAGRRSAVAGEGHPDSIGVLHGEGPLWPALVAGAFAGVAILGLGGLSHQMLISTSDPMVVTLCLAAVDAQLSGHPRLAFTALLLASLGRPETWPFAFLYAAWAWRAVRGMRIMLLLGVLLIPAAWFIVPALTSHSWLISGQLALKSPDVIHGNRLTGVLSRFFGIYELPMQIAVLAAVVIAAVLRYRAAITIAVAACLWVAVEVAFAYHGWPASPRYLLEGAAVLVPLAGAGIGWVLRASAEHRGWLLSAGPAAVVALMIALVPVAQSRVGRIDRQLGFAKRADTRIVRLGDVVTVLGGRKRIEACGHPVTTVGFQSALAWYLGLNVGQVGYKPGREIRHGYPILLFMPRDLGWNVRPIHSHASKAALCRSMRINLGWDGAGLRGAPAPSGALRPFGHLRHHRRGAHARHRRAEHRVHHRRLGRRTHCRTGAHPLARRARARHASRLPAGSAVSCRHRGARSWSRAGAHHRRHRG